MAGDVRGAPIERVEVDLNTRIVARAENFYVVRPGRGSWLFNEFDRLEAVFLDFPYLDIDLRAKPDDLVQLRLKLARSIDLNAWLRSRRDQEAPSRDLADYVGKIHRRRLGRYVGAIETLYYDLPDGAIITAPGPNDVSDVLVGEIAGPARLSAEVIPYHGEKVPIRPVKWLGRRQKATLSRDFRERLATPNPVMLLERTLREEVLRIGYDQYVIDDHFSTRFRTEADDYSSLDDADITSFINYVAGLLVAADEGISDPGTVTASEALASLRRFRDRVPELSTNISSPGFLRLLSGCVDPLAIAVIMAIALAGAGAVNANDVHVVNSAGMVAHDHVIRVSEQARNAMSMMTFDDFQEKVNHFVSAAHNVRLGTSVKAHVVRHRL